MGTPDFAVPTLKALHNTQHEVVLVVTQPDRPKGRGRKIIPSPIKEAAIRMGDDVIQPESIKTKAFADQMLQLSPDMIVVVAFGRILPKTILQLPPLGAINVHASLLPKYRGAAPIQWAIINGETETGVTTMLMDEGLDTGDILLSEKIKIASDDTSASLHDRLADLGAKLLVRTLEAFERNEIHPIAQDSSIATYAPLLKKNDGRINWKAPAEKLEAFIRGVTPWPGAFTFHGIQRIRIFKVEPCPIDVDELPGTVIKSFPNELRVATGKGILSILEIQGTSGKRLLIKDFLRGYPLSPGTVLE
ncbi:MAG: methionyl-tRNA formyltransferase [Desulfobacterales bacterium]|nr:methionyl-tRNA formyltransferase [Desulfobacterales bacterium]